MEVAALCSSRDLPRYELVTVTVIVGGYECYFFPVKSRGRGWGAGEDYALI